MKTKYNITIRNEGDKGLIVVYCFWVDRNTTKRTLFNCRFRIQKSPKSNQQTG